MSATRVPPSVGVLAEVAAGERRVAMSPDGARRLVAGGREVRVEPGAGDRAGFTDDEYVGVGAEIASRAEILAKRGVLLQVRVSGTHPEPDGVAEAIGPGHVLIGLADPLWQAGNIERLAGTGATVLALELVPRTTRAQSMDVLSAMATVAGYEAVLLAAAHAPRMFPMLMTAAGTVPPTRVFVMGAGVAGLQAISTARRLGAVVEAYDVRPAAVEQIRSVGAKPIELDLSAPDAEDAGGYARERTHDEQARQQALLTPVVADADVVITTAAVPGAPSPELISAEMVEAMRPGSVIVDIAAERGGNCALTRADEEVFHHGVQILGPTDLVSRSPRNASTMLSNNVVALLEHLGDDAGFSIDSDDPITAAMLVAAGGSIVHGGVRERVSS